LGSIIGFIAVYLVGAGIYLNGGSAKIRNWVCHGLTPTGLSPDISLLS
jgi:hypothetical protein